VRWFLNAANPATALPPTLKAGAPYEMPSSASGTTARIERRSVSRVLCPGSATDAR
jgi:hypothetical protein